MLRAWVEAGESGPVIMLAGEADLTSREPLDQLIAGQIARDTRQLTIDASQLRYADAASIMTLALAARTLSERGGSLVMLDPQPSVARVLGLLDVDEIVTIHRRSRVPRPRPQLEASAPGEAQRDCGSAGPRKARDERGVE